MISENSLSPVPSSEADYSGQLFTCRDTSHIKIRDPLPSPVHCIQLLADAPLQSDFLALLYFTQYFSSNPENKNLSEIGEKKIFNLNFLYDFNETFKILILTENFPWSGRLIESIFLFLVEERRGGHR